MIEIKQYTVAEYLTELMNQHGDKLGKEIAYRIEDKETSMLIAEANNGMHLECYETIDPYMMMKSKVISIEKTDDYYGYKYDQLAQTDKIKKNLKSGYIIQIDTKTACTIPNDEDEIYLLMSDEHQYVYEMIQGNKTIEVRTRIPNWVLKNIEKGKKVKALVYCTLGRKQLIKVDRSDYMIVKGHHEASEACGYYYQRISGTIPLLVQINKIEKISYEAYIVDSYNDSEEMMYMTDDMKEEDLCKKACITSEKLHKYLKGRVGYAMHIEKLTVFDNPKELNEFYKVLSEKEKNMLFEMDLPMWKKVNKAPQSMMAVKIKGGIQNG